MNKLKDLINVVYNNLQESEWVNEYPELKEMDIVSEIIQDIALEMMPDYVPRNKLEEFVDESEKSYNEKTFKKYVEDYSNFLDNVEQEFYAWLLIWLVRT